MSDGPLRRLSIWSNRCALLVIVCWLGLSGCATSPYRYGQFQSSEHHLPSEVAFEYGRPQKTLDNLAWTLGLWSRLLPLNKDVNNHRLSEDCRAKLTAYLNDNDLTDVLIRVNQYDPKGEWRRLRQNQIVAPGWRYTIGLVSLAKYTLIPGRVFGGDEYNPYTNSLYLNSDVPAVVLHEAAYAKDIHSRSFPGTYAVVNEIPLVSLWRHTKGCNDVLGYALTDDDWIVERETYRVVYPQMGVHSMAMAGTVVPFWDGLILSVAGAAAGHATGQYVISKRTKERQSMHENSVSQSPPEAEEGDSEIPNNPSTVKTIHLTNHEIESDDPEEEYTARGPD